MSENTREAKIELLAPVGSVDALEAAVVAGANGVYLGVGRFSARRRAEGFSGEPLREAVRYAHRNGVKVYGALNTILRESELDEFSRAVADAYEAGVDGAIVQDWAAARIVRETAPEMRLHASTQMNAHNGAIIDFLAEKGFSRATLARELTLDEIGRLAREHSLELEVFAHGALCFSYSGQCLISSMVGGRSGNRGLCPQVCRLAYELYRDGRKVDAPGKHILSTKDLCTLSILDELASAGVSSIKIEGRLKSADYVSAVTRVYRKALDRLESGEFSVGPEDEDELMLAFNRGFTPGYLKGVRDGRLMGYGRPSDRGLMLGRVAFVDVFTGEVGIALQRTIKLGDRLGIWVSKGGRVEQRVADLTVDGATSSEASAGSRAVVKVEVGRHRINLGDRVFLTERASKERPGGRIPMTIDMRVAEGAPLSAKATAAGVGVVVNGRMAAEKAEKRSLTKDAIAKQLAKLGDSDYELAELTVEVEGEPSLPVSEINELRRRIVAALDERRLEEYESRVSPSGKRAARPWKHPKHPKGRRRPAEKRPGLEVVVTAIAGATAALEMGAERVFLKVRSSAARDIEEARRLTESAPGAGLAFGNIVRDDDMEGYIALAGSLPKGASVVCDNIGLAKLLREAGIGVALDYHLNLLNGIAREETAELAPAGVTASVEASLEDIEALGAFSPDDLAVVVHGSIEVMTAEHPLVDECSGGCGGLELEDRIGVRFPAVVDGAGRTHIYNSKELCLLAEIPAIVAAGGGSIRLLLELYDPAEVRQVVEVYRLALDEYESKGSVSETAKRAKNVHPSFSDHTTGHYYRPVL